MVQNWVLDVRNAANSPLSNLVGLQIIAGWPSRSIVSCQSLTRFIGYLKRHTSKIIFIMYCIFFGVSKLSPNHNVKIIITVFCVA